jgi:hypothetical protein
VLPPLRCQRPWLAGWEGPIQIDARDVNLTVDGDLAFVSATAPENRLQQFISASSSAIESISFGERASDPTPQAPANANDDSGPARQVTHHRPLPLRVHAELATTSANIRTEVADAADATVAWSLLDQYAPEVLILVARP